MVGKIPGYDFLRFYVLAKLNNLMDFFCLINKTSNHIDYIQYMHLILTSILFTHLFLSLQTCSSYNAILKY